MRNCSQRVMAGVRLCSSRRFSSPGQKPVSTRIGLRIFPSRSSIPSAVQVTPNQSAPKRARARSEEHTSELQSHVNLVCRLLLEKKKKKKKTKEKKNT